MTRNELNHEDLITVTKNARFMKRTGGAMSSSAVSMTSNDWPATIRATVEDGRRVWVSRGNNALLRSANAAVKRGELALVKRNVQVFIGERHFDVYESAK